MGALIIFGVDMCDFYDCSYDMFYETGKTQDKWRRELCAPPPMVPRRAI